MDEIAFYVSPTDSDRYERVLYFNKSVL